MKTIHNTLPDPSGRYIFHQPVDQITFFDIETTGLSSKTASIYLIGAMHYNCPTGSWELTQWFADDYQSEPEILEAFLSYLKDFSYLYHFNGCTFDIPFITAKCEKHGILPSPEVSGMLKNVISSRSSEPAPANIDLLKEIRPLKKRLGLEKANQSYLERWVGLNREDIYNGGQLIKVYSEYMQQKILHKEKGTELKKLLLLHNHDDIAGMIHVCSMLAYQDFFSPAEPAPVTVTHLTSNNLTLELPVRIPRKITLEHSFSMTDAAESQPENAILTLDKTAATLSLPLYRGTLKYFFPDHKDYYYLPQEDTAIHKSVAQFVDTSCRQKATAANCYTKKEGVFLPSLSTKEPALKEDCFYYAHKTKPAFYLLPDTESGTMDSFLTDYVFREICNF